MSGETVTTSVDHIATFIPHHVTTVAALQFRAWDKVIPVTLSEFAFDSLQ